MAANSDQIRENLFEKQHTEAVQALIWALHLRKRVEAKNLSDDELKKSLAKLKQRHQAYIQEDPELQKIYDDIVSGTKLSNVIAADLKKYEKDFLENLERKAKRHKLSIFFAFFMALGCGTTLAGSNVLLAAEQGVLGINAVLTSLVILSVPIIAVVTRANWWLGVRAVFDLENTNKDPHTIIEKSVGEYKGWRKPFFALGYFFIEMFNGLGLNFKEKTQKTQDEDKYFWLRLFLNLTVLLGALIYAFFAFVTTFELGMAIFEVMQMKGLAGAGVGAMTAAVGTSAGMGLLMAIPTYITMKVIYYMCCRDMLTKGPGVYLDKIPDIDKPNDWGITLRHKFYFGAFFIIASIGSQTWAAAEPLADWFIKAGMESGPALFLAGPLVGLAFIGNIPFFLMTAAKSYKQMHDPVEKLKFINNKWFPYIRFWNAVFNSIPAVVGFLAILGAASLNPIVFIGLAIVGNMVLSYASGEASYFANSNGSPDMYQFDPVKQMSQFHIQQLEKLEKGKKAFLVSREELCADEQLLAEFVGSTSYSDVNVNSERVVNIVSKTVAKLIAESIQREVAGIVEGEKAALYQALVSPPASLIYDRLVSAVSHSNEHYTKEIFPYDYLERVERYASEPVKKRMYEIALEGGGNETVYYKDLFNDPSFNITQVDLSYFISKPQASLFWKAYAMQDAKKQEQIWWKFKSICSKPQHSIISDQLIRHARPETREAVFLYDEVIPDDKRSPQYFYNTFTQAHYWSLNFPTLSFWVDNLSFPFVMLGAVARSALSYVGRHIPAIGPYVTPKITEHEFFSELATDMKRKDYLSNVLHTYLLQNPGDKQAEVLQMILDGDTATHFPADNQESLTTGLVGMVFTYAGRIPSVRPLLEKALAKESYVDVDPVTGPAVETSSFPSSPTKQPLLLSNDTITKPSSIIPSSLPWNIPSRLQTQIV